MAPVRDMTEDFIVIPFSLYEHLYKLDRELSGCIQVYLFLKYSIVTPRGYDPDWKNHLPSSIDESAYMKILDLLSEEMSET